MKLTKRHVEICIEEGFARAALGDYGEEKALFAELDEDGETVMIFRPSGRAWMVVDRSSPKAITEPWSGGRRPVHSFDSVRDAARLAKSGIYY